VIDHGSWTACDPLEKITVHGQDNALLGESLFESTGGVKILSYRLLSNGEGVQFQEVPNEDE
jgi:hypothetical protein